MPRALPPPNATPTFGRPGPLATDGDACALAAGCAVVARCSGAAQPAPIDTTAGSTRSHVRPIRRSVARAASGPLRHIGGVIVVGDVRQPKENGRCRRSLQNPGAFQSFAPMSGGTLATAVPARSVDLRAMSGVEIVDRQRC